MLSSQDMWDMPFSLPLADVAAREGDASEGRPRTVTHWAAHICYAIIAFVFKIAFRYSTVGLGNLRRLHGVSGAVVACAHFSYLDPAFLWITARPKQWIRFMARDTIFGNAHGLAGQVVSRAAGFPVKRDAADRVAIKRAAAMLKRGEIVGLVGESGSGKSTIGRALLGLIPSAGGNVKVLGQELVQGHGRRKVSQGKNLKSLRRRVGVIFQDPAASLNPRLPVGDVISEPLEVHRIGNKASRQKRVYELLEAVELPRSAFNRYPHELSGGQRQRVSIARALSLSPDLLIADEPTSALDVSVQAQVLGMLTDLQRDFGFACLFISHDLAVIDSLAHRVVVMQHGKIVEKGARAQVLLDPQEEYTKRLLAAAPVPNPVEQRERREERHRLLEALGDEVVEIDTRELDQ